MDCEKFETTMIDELYDELDELTSAAAKRHAAGCARCASLFGGLRATRRVAVLPIDEPPAGLEERILAAARQAQKVVPLRSRVARLVSTAGSWAMRPQTAMAALFLLMIGSGAFIVRMRNTKSSGSSTVTVSQLGAPSPAASAAEDPYRIDGQQLQAKGGDLTLAHGEMGPTGGGRPADKTAVDGLAKDDRRAAKADPEEEHKVAARSGGPQSWANNYNGLPPSMDNAAPVPFPMAPPPPAAAAGPNAAAHEAQAQTATTSANPTFNSAMAAFNAQQYGEAYRMFNSLAANDTHAALYAARSLQQVSGCSAAASRYDEVAQRGSGTRDGWDATLEGGRCYRLIGAFDMARDHMRGLLAVPGYAAAAQQELDAIDRASASASRARAAAPAAPPAATATPPATATATAAPPANAADTGY